MKIFAVSLGCPKNGIDTEVAIASIKKAFHSIEIVPDPQKAQIILINTCGFIQSAVSESIETILTLAKNKKKSQKIVVIGCMVERYPVAELIKELPEVDLFLGTNIYESVGREIKQNLFSHSLDIIDSSTDSQERFFNSVTPLWRAYIKISEGCSNTCSYCLIPKLRGRQNSISPEKILSEIKELQKNNVKEITLVAQDLTAYQYNNINIEGLLEKIVQNSNISWIRLLYLHPQRLSRELINIIKNNRNICPYFDIPIQHASNKILRLMARRYKQENLRELFAHIRDVLPEASIRTTVITGFPGETLDDFEILKEFISEIGFDHLGAFTYSDEEEAPACNLKDKVPEKVALQRKKDIIRIQKSISKKRLKRWKDKTVDVLIEGISQESELLYYGRTMHQAPDIDGVVYLSGEIKKLGEIIPVRINDTHIYDMAGETEQKF